MTDSSVDDAPTTPATVLSRMVAAGLGEEKARRWIAAGDVVVDGQRPTDPDAPCPAGTRWVINPR